MEPLDIFIVYIFSLCLVVLNFTFSDEHEPPLSEDDAKKFGELIEGGGSPGAEIEQQGTSSC